MKSVLVEPSPLDSARFGHAIGRSGLVGAADVPQLLREAAELDLEMVIARCRADDQAGIRSLLDAGSRFMDGELHYRGPLIELGAQFPSAEVEIRPVQRSESGAVELIAGACFADYGGHYHADPRLDHEAAGATYVDWAHRCVAGEAADETLAALLEGEVVGFSAFRLTPDSEVRLVLGAVLPSARGVDLYSRLTLAGANWAQARGGTEMVCITQVGNLAAQRSWVRVGLRPAAAAYTFHLWRR